MQKEEKIVLMLLIMALGSLTVASWELGDFDDGTNEMKSISKDQPGRSVVIEGVVRDLRPTNSGGHLVIMLQSSNMPIFVSRQSGADLVIERIDKGDRLRVAGAITEYGGRREIVVERPEDLEVLDFESLG